MADFPYNAAGKFKTYGAVTASSTGTTITAAGSTHTKGSYTEITASTDFQATGFILCMGKVNSDQRFLVDVAIGAAASEVVIAPNLILRARGNTANLVHVYLPLSIPAGTRLSVRCQSETASATFLCTIVLVNTGFAALPSYGKLIDIGTVTASTQGTTYTTSGTAVNTKSPYQELTASTSAPIKAFFIVHSSSTFAATATYLFDIAVGAAGSEQIIIDNFFALADTTNLSQTHYSGILPCNIPAGSRLSYREASSLSDANNFTILALYGFI